MDRGLLRTSVDGPAAVGEGSVCARAGRLAGCYEALMTMTETTAVRWRWATPTSGHGDVEPLRLQRMGCSPGRWLHRPPPPWQEHEAIGFDAFGRVVCVRQYDATGEIWLEQFSLWRRDQVEVACFRAPLECGGRELPAELQSVTRVRLAGGKPVEGERFMPPTGSCSRERYRHDGGRLTRVEEESCDGGALSTVVKEVVYGEDGRITRIDALGTDGRHTVWGHGEQLPPAPAPREARPLAPGRLRRQVCV
jgi:hypothetical protein